MGQRRLTKTEMEQLIVTLRERFEASRVKLGTGRSKT